MAFFIYLFIFFFLEFFFFVKLNQIHIAVSFCT